MRKIYLALAMALIVTAGYAQKKNVNSAYNETWQDAPDFDNARKLIKEAFQDSTTMNWVKTWATAGMVEMKFFETELTKAMSGGSANEEAMYNALKEAYDYFLVAVDLDAKPDEKGKVKPKFTRDIKDQLHTNMEYFYYGGGYFLNKQNNQKAYEMFMIFEDLCKKDFMASFKIDCADSMHMQARYLAAIMAYSAGDKDGALDAFLRSKEDNFNGLDVYNAIANIYAEKNDTVNQIAILKEGIDKFGEEANSSEYGFMSQLINIYINKSDINTAISMLNESLNSDPNNKEYWKVLGSLYYEQKDEANAINALEKAIEIDPTYADAYGEIGRIYYNAAVNESNKANEIQNNAEYRKAKEEIVKPAFQKAIPYYEKAHEYKPDEKGFLYNLKSIYYNIDDGANLERVEKLLGE